MTALAEMLPAAVKIDPIALPEIDLPTVDVLILIADPKQTLKAAYSLAAAAQLDYPRDHVRLNLVGLERAADTDSSKRSTITGILNSPTPYNSGEDAYACWWKYLMTKSSIAQLAEWNRRKQRMCCRPLVEMARVAEERLDKIRNTPLQEETELPSPPAKQHSRSHRGPGLSRRDQERTISE